MARPKKQPQLPRDMTPEQLLKNRTLRREYERWRKDRMTVFILEDYLTRVEIQPGLNLELMKAPEVVAQIRAYEQGMKTAVAKALNLEMELQPPSEELREDWSENPFEEERQ